MYKDWRGIVYPEKLPQRRWFEHYATLLDTVELNNTFYRLPPPSTAEGWAAQAPAGFTYALKLGAFGSHRMKLRDASWVHPETFDVLRKHETALCIHDLLADHPWELTTDWTYLRFHGPNALEEKYLGLYGPEKLEPVAGVAQQWLSDGIDVYGYFNNDWYGYAVQDATWLRDRLGGAAR